MKIKYGDYDENFDPRSIAWEFEWKDYQLDFPFSVQALYSDSLNLVVVEAYQKNKLKFDSPEAQLVAECDIPCMDDFKYWGINKNKKSKTGGSLLYFPTSDKVGNEWGDIEQYELEYGAEIVLGKRIGIYR